MNDCHSFFFFFLFFKSETDEDNETIGPKLSEQSVTLDAEGVIKKEEMEREAEERRKAHVREWDKDKRRGQPSFFSRI